MATPTVSLFTPPHLDPEPSAVQFTMNPDGITTIGINRMHKKNSIDPLTARKLHTAFLAFDNEPSQKVCVLHGIGGTFCSGFDLSDIENWDMDATTASSSSSNSPNQQQQQQGGITRKQFPPVTGLNPGPLGPTRLHLTKPVICAISGFAVAGGLELAAIADLRVVDSDAKFGVFNRRLGVPLLDGLTIRLPALIGLGRALDLILTGRTVDAAEALSIGLVNRVVTPGTAFEEAMRLARTLAAFPQEGMRADRASVYYGVYEAGSLGDGLSREYEGAMEVADLAIGRALRFARGSKL